MLRKLSKEQRDEFQKIITSLGESLDISKSQYDALVVSYEAVGEFLQNDLELSKYNPIVTPQGSLRLGTIIQPINPDDDIDVDLVFRLSEKEPHWTQKDIKEKVGARLKSSKRYEPMLLDEKKRCWTLKYRDDSPNLREHYHMDILPAVSTRDYDDQMRDILAEGVNANNLDRVAIRITDNTRPEYAVSSNIADWLKSNPDGYAIWFANRCRERVSKTQLLTEEIVPLKSYNPNKTPLQRIVQILKRHRDIMFQGDDKKPISIIITTLAAQAYNGESDIIEGLVNVVLHLKDNIQYRNGVAYVLNPLNSQENFADKWPGDPKLEQNFNKWYDQLVAELSNILNSKGTDIWNGMAKSFGRTISESAHHLYASRKSSAIKSGTVKVATTGVLGAVGQALNAANTFHGKED